MHICMDWRHIKFDWNRARAFLVTAEEGSLSAAAKALRMSQPTLSRQVAALEEELGVVLFERFGRGLELTPSGVDLLAYVRAMGEAASGLAVAASGQATSIEGDITVSASEIAAAYILPPMLHALQRDCPGIRVALIASNNPSDLLRREADIAIRNFRPAEPELIARKAGNFHAGLFAASSYLDEHGIPASREQLGAARFVGFDASNDGFIQALAGHGIALTPKQFVMRSDSHLIQWQMVKAGAGIGIVPVEIGAGEPGVQRLLPDVRFDWEAWLVTHRELKTNLRVRTVFDFLAQAFADHARRVASLG